MSFICLALYTVFGIMSAAHYYNRTSEWKYCEEWQILSGVFWPVYVVWKLSLWATKERK